MSEPTANPLATPAPRVSDHYAVCPWCGYEHGDCWEWVTDTLQETRCDGCDNAFTVEANHSVFYRSYVSGDEKGG